jgi:hypothetical protein
MTRPNAKGKCSRCHAVVPLSKLPQHLATCPDLAAGTPPAQAPLLDTGEGGRLGGSAAPINNGSGTVAPPLEDMDSSDGDAMGGTGGDLPPHLPIASAAMEGGNDDQDALLPAAPGAYAMEGVEGVGEGVLPPAPLAVVDPGGTGDVGAAPTATKAHVPRRLERAEPLASEYTTPVLKMAALTNQYAIDNKLSRAGATSLWTLVADVAGICNVSRARARVSVCVCVCVCVCEWLFFFL